MLAKNSAALRPNTFSHGKQVVTVSPVRWQIHSSRVSVNILTLFRMCEFNYHKHKTTDRPTFTISACISACNCTGPMYSVLDLLARHEQVKVYITSAIGRRSAFKCDRAAIFYRKCDHRPTSDQMSLEKLAAN